MPIDTPTPTPNATATPNNTATPTATTTPNQTATPTATIASTPAQQTTATIAPSPALPLQPTAGGISLTGVTIGLLFGVALTAMLFSAMAARKKKNKPERSAPRPTGAFVEGLEIGNAQNIGKRSNQEDAFATSDINNQRLVSESGILTVVADGMGGLADGELVSSAAVAAVYREFPMLSNDWMPQQKLLYLVQRANDAANGVTGGSRNQGGSTLVMTLVRDGKLWFASVGDSRICLVRDGSLITLTRPHVYETDLDKRAACGSISFEAALADGQRCALTSYVGMGELEQIDYHPRGIQLLSGDWVLLMTDGVFNTLDEEEIASALFGDAQNAAERIESRVIAKGLPRQDNMTIIALRMI